MEPAKKRAKKLTGPMIKVAEDEEPELQGQEEHEKRYKLPESFVPHKYEPLLPPKVLNSEQKELWLVQLPAKMDLSSLSGVWWKARLHAQDGIIGHLETSQGVHLQALAGPSELAAQFTAVVPSSSDKGASAVRRCDRHVTLVKAIPVPDSKEATKEEKKRSVEQQQSRQETGSNPESTKKRKKKSKLEAAPT